MLGFKPSSFIAAVAVNWIVFSGDDGKDGSFFAGLSGLFASAQMANGNFDRQDIAEKFQNLFGYRFEEFMNLELANITAEEESHLHNPSKYLLFNDPLLGLFDYTVHDALKARYAAATRTVQSSINGREYDYLFDFQAKLLTLLTRKCDLGLRLRKAYQTQDKETLAKLLEEEMERVVSLAIPLTAEAHWGHNWLEAKG